MSLCCRAALNSKGSYFALTSAAVHWCCITAHLYEEQMSIGAIAVAQGCGEPVSQSSTEQQGSCFAITIAATHWCCITPHLYEEQMPIGAIAVELSCCEPVLQSFTSQVQLDNGKQLANLRSINHWNVLERCCIYNPHQGSNDIFRLHLRVSIYVGVAQSNMTSDFYNYAHLLHILTNCVGDFKKTAASGNELLTVDESFALLSLCRELFAFGAETSQLLVNAATSAGSAAGCSQSHYSSEAAETTGSDEAESSPPSPTVSA